MASKDGSCGEVEEGRRKGSLCFTGKCVSVARARGATIELQCCTWLPLLKDWSILQPGPASELLHLENEPHQ